jgi:hypothetical protein
MESEISRLVSQIRAEYEAAQNGLSGLAQGTARHDFITARIEQIGRLHSQLQGLVGEDEAMSIVAQTLEKL